MKDLKTRLRELRIDNDLSMDALAAKVGTYQSRISDIENGKAHIRAEDLPKYAKALNTTVSYIVTGYDEGNELLPKDLGLSNTAINNIRQMDANIIEAFEYLINDELYGMALASFMSSEKQGIWLDGKQIAKDSDYINIGNPGEYSETIKVSDLVATHRQRHILQLLQSIRNERSADR